MRIPWTATIDALIDELNQYLDMPHQETSAGRSTEARGVLEFIKEKRPLNHPQAQIKLAIEHLSEARQQLEDIRSFRVRSYQSAPGREAELSDFDYMDLDQLDSRQVRYPDQEGREALARIIEKGGLYGPILSQHIADVVRGSAKLKPGLQLTFEEGRQRRFAVKRIATIKHLYAVGTDKAVKMYCADGPLDDPNDTAVERLKKWVKRDQHRAKEQLETDCLSQRDERHLRGILFGLYSDLPKGLLQGQPYPQALQELKDQIES